jgi:hypothetical protein
MECLLEVVTHSARVRGGNGDGLSNGDVGGTFATTQPAGKEERMRMRKWRDMLTMTVLAGTLLAGPALSQEGGAPAQPPPDEKNEPETPTTPPAPVPVPTAPVSRASSAAGDSALALPMLVTPRARDEIERDRRLYTGMKAEAGNRLLAAREQEMRYRSRSELKKSEIESTKKSIDLAKKDKRESEKKDLESQKKRLEAQARFLDRMRDVSTAQADVQEAVSSYAQSRLPELDVETQLIDLQSDDPVVRGSVDTQQLMAKAVTAIKDRATRMEALAGKEKALADKRKAALDAWSEMNK